MLSKSRISLIRSLEQKKNRDKTGLFVAEGEKICADLLESGLAIHSLYFTARWKTKNEIYLNKLSAGTEYFEVTESELSRISLLNTPNQVLALAYIQTKTFSDETDRKGPVLMLENIQDPGNLGSIIRSADWFGFRNILVSPDSADLYSPKVIQAAMGSVFRTQCRKIDLLQMLKENRPVSGWPVLAAVLDGAPVFKERLPENAFYLFGNEANGVSLDLLMFCDKRITIPAQPVQHDQLPSDSLNVAVAAAVVMAEYCRQRTT